MTLVVLRFPPGVFNCVPSYGPIGGAALTSHLDVDKVAFTGSTLTARKIMQAAALSNLKKVSTITKRGARAALIPMARLFRIGILHRSPSNWVARAPISSLHPLI